MGLKNIIQQEIDFIKRCEVLIQDLEYQPDYTPQAAFKCLDKFGLGKAGEVDLTDFLRSLGGRLIDREVFAIIRRIDTDGDAKISYEEFCDFICSDVNKETAMHMKPNSQTQESTKKKNPKKPPQKEHRSFEFETPSVSAAAT